MAESESEPGSVAASESSPAEDFAKTKRRRLIGMVGLSIALGAAEQLFADAGLEKELQIGGAICFIMLVVAWCHADARARDYVIGMPLLVAIVLFAIVGLPIYFIRTRGIRGVWSCLLALLFMGALIVLERIVIQITSYLM